MITGSLEEVNYEGFFTQAGNPRTEKHTMSLEAGKLKVAGWKHFFFFSHKEQSLYRSNCCMLLLTLQILAGLLNMTFQ